MILEASTQEIEGDGKVERVNLADGTVLEADIVVMAVGIRPAVTLAKDAGLDCGRAIKVDAQMRTSDPDIYAVGECVEFEGNLFGLVAPLYDQAKVLAATLTGNDATFAMKELSTSILRGRTIAETSLNELDEINQYISKHVVDSRKALLVTTLLHGQVVLRMCLINPRTSLEDVTETLDLCKKFALEKEELMAGKV